MCRKCTRYKTILLPLLSFSYYHLSIVFTRIMCEIRIYLKFLNRGILDWLCHLHNTFFLRRWWKIGDPGKQTYKSLPTQGWCNSWPLTHNKLLRQQVHKTLIHYLWPIMTTCPFYRSKCTHQTQVNHQITLVVEDWRQLSGEVDPYDNWRQADVRTDENCFLFIFLWRESIFGEKNGNFFFLWKQGHSEEDQDMEEDHNTKLARDTGVEKHSCQIELRGVHVKLVYYNNKQVLRV
jgi:hypothetical protein